MKEPAKKQKPALLTLFLGDPYLRRKKTASFIDQILPKENQAFQIERVDLKEALLAEVIRKARSYPMMGENQVFSVRLDSALKKSDAELLENYFSENPSAWSFFIFEAETLDANHPLIPIVSKYGQRIEVSVAERATGLGFIHQKLKYENRTMTKEAWQLLQEKTGGNLALLDACVDKLILYSDEKTSIDPKTVQKLADEFFVCDLFDLTNAMAEKNAKKAVEVFRFIYQLEGSVIGMVGMINWQLKRIWQAKKILSEEGEAAVFRKFRMSPDRSRIFLKQVSQFSLNELNEAIEKLFQLDWKLKTGAFNDRIALETLIIELATEKKKPALA